MSRDFYQNVRMFGVSLGYTALVESDFTAAAGTAYTPPERGNYRRNNVARSLQFLADIAGVVETFQLSAADVWLPSLTLADSTNDAGNGRLILFKNSGTGIVTIKDYLGVTLWLAKQSSILFIVGNDNNNWDFYFTAKNIDFDNSTNGYVSNELQSAVEESRSKADKITYTSFTGNPKKAVVVFTQPFPDAEYGVTLTGVDRRQWSVENQTANGFTINSNANQPITSSVFYVAAKKWS